MSYLRTFSGENALKSVGTYAAFDFTQIERVTTGEVQLLDTEIGKPGPKQNSTLIFFRTGAVIALSGDDEKRFLEPWNRYVAESQQRERVADYANNR